MPLYEVDVRGESREIFLVEAESPEEATNLWWSGSATQSQSLEITDVEVYDVVEVSK